MKTLLPEINSSDKRFHNGDPATGEQGTRVTDTWLNDVQDRVRDVQAEAHYVLLKAGFTPKQEQQTQLYQAIVKIIDDNRKKASTTQKGEVQLYSGYDSESEEMAATPKAIKLLKAFIDALTRSLSHYIPNSKKSSRVDSDSSDTIADSKAVKTAYDKAQEAKNAADNAQLTADAALPLENKSSKVISIGNYKFTFQTDGNFVVSETNGKVKYHFVGVYSELDKRVMKAGDTMTGDLSIKNGTDWSRVKLYNAKGNEIRIESLPDTERNYMKLSYRLPNDTELNYALLPKQNGTLAMVEDVRNVIRKNYTKTIKGTRADWDNGTSKNINVTGYTEVYPDGRIVQFFHLQNFRLSWFALEKAVNDSVRIPEMSIDLWTAMPSKITWAEAHISRTEGTGVTVSLTAGAEASEWLKPIWAFEKQPGTKNKVSLYLRRWFGGADEAVDMMIKVEGY